MFQISEVLKKVPFFRTLGKEGIDFIVERLKFKPYDANETICKIGDPGDQMYIIISGKVKVVVYDPETGKETVIAYLGSGDYFGEMALLTGEPRSASVITTEPSEMFILYKNDFDVIVERFPSITLSMGKIMSQRLRETLQKAAKKESGGGVSTVKGSLAEKGLVEILKFCETNSLNGKVILKHGEETGTIIYKRGELEKVTLGDLNEDEAMDRMLSWQEGEFVIEPEPLKLEEQESEHQEEPTRTPDLLIINSSMVVQKMLQRTFENIGYNVYAVDNKAKGLTLIEKLQPDVVVVDTKLPDASGEETVRAIRAFSQVPLVVLTDEKNRPDYQDKLSDVAGLAFTRSGELSEIMHAVQEITGSA